MARKRPGRVLGGLVLVTLLVLLVAAPLLAGRAGATVGSHGSAGAVVVPATSGVQASVTWNGVSVDSADSISSAISTNFASTIDLHYSWSSVTVVGILGGPLYNISDARLQMFYFGYALATRDVLDASPSAATSGSFDMEWDPGVLQWLLAGTYGITVSLLAPNGTTVWSEPFFIHVNAPGGVGAIIPILLIVIGIYEIYELARSGRQAAIDHETPPPAGPSKPGGGSTPPSDAAGGTGSGTDGVPPKEGS
jgi:hypothetical protein